MRGLSIQAAELTIRGLKYDRYWMVARHDGTFLTQRRIPQLATIEAGISDDKLKLRDQSGDSFLIPLHAAGREEVSVEIWGDVFEAFDEGDEVSEWLTTRLSHSGKKPLRLIQFKNSVKREVDQEFQKGENAHTAFADGFPFLITSTSSLEALNDRLAGSGTDPVEMNRFRPNIVIDGLGPFQENEFNQLTSSKKNYRLGIRKPCKRCKITTVDQLTGKIENPKEPLRTLMLMNTVPHLEGAYFGQNATLLSGERRIIRVKDELEAH